MRFISNGDFLLPLHFPTYLAQHIYIWSYERGAANPDGILRLPGRLIDILVFALAGNVGFGYFYLVSCLAISFAAFWWFAKRFLEADRRGTLFLGALLFACNPIFLGNASKVGLILAASMLPIALTALKLGFAERRMSYFLLYIAALNVSLLHPFTFAVNMLVSGIYLVVVARKQRSFLRDNIWKFGLLILVTPLLYAYCLLPLGSMGTLDKSALSDSVASTPVDYTSLVDIANTGDIFTGLSLSKGVLKDYEFYGAMTWPFYFLGVFLLYALLFGMYVQVEKRAKPHERQRFVLALGLFLGLLVMATASYLQADVLIKFLIGLPGGWMFRSPLKWQLYMPFALFMALVIALKYVRSGWRLKLLYAGLVCSFILMNGYLLRQICQRLLTPRQVSNFSALHAMDLTNKNLLFADSGVCMGFARDNPKIATELNQVLISKPVQVKHVQAAQIDTVSLSQYDYIMGCSNTFDQKLLTDRYAFTLERGFVDNVYALYKNTKPLPYIGASAHLFTLDQAQALGGKQSLANILELPFQFTTKEQPLVAATGLQDIFDNLSPASVAHQQVWQTLQPLTVERQQLFITGDQPVFLRHQDNRLQLSAVQEPGMEPAPAVVDLENHDHFEVSYTDPNFDYENLVPNPSIEQGPWQQAVGDCNNHDNKSSLDMRTTTATKTDGRQSLELTARAHIACTGPNELAVKEQGHYLLSFDYQTEDGPFAGYYVGFDNLDATSSSARLPETHGRWQSFATELIAPDGAEQLRLLLYAYSATTPGKGGLARYDNLRLTHIPTVTNRFFMVSGRPETVPSAPRISYSKQNPTKTIIHVENASVPFYLTTKESYHQLWKLQSKDGRDLPNHLKLNSTLNGWYIQPADFCNVATNCEKQSDGSYDFTLTMQFEPQHWFYVGVTISIATAVATMAYVGHDIWWHRRERT
jgi:hypothetical protein